MPKPGINVYFKPGAVKQYGGFNKAMKALNVAAGANVVRRVNKPQDADIIVHLGWAGKKYLGYASDIPKTHKQATTGKTHIVLEKSAGKEYFKKGTHKATQVGRAVKQSLTMHELGHAAGLEHKKKGKANLMAPSGIGMQLTPQQAKILRKIAGYKGTTRKVKPKIRPTTGRDF